MPIDIKGGQAPNNLNPRWKGYGEIPGTIWWVISNNAKKRGMPVQFTIQDAWNLFLNQERKCALSGLELKFADRRFGDNTASLDRIDSSIGYLLDNVQWVHKHINIMKRDHSDEYFIYLCKLIAAYNIGDLP